MDLDPTWGFGKIQSVVLDMETRIRELEAQLERCRSANVYDGNAHRMVSELEAALSWVLKHFNTFAQPPEHLKGIIDDACLKAMTADEDAVRATSETYDLKCREAGYVLQDGVLVCVNCRRAADEIFADDSEAETACDCAELDARGGTGDMEVFCPKCGKVFRRADGASTMNR